MTWQPHPCPTMEEDPPLSKKQCHGTPTRPPTPQPPQGKQEQLQPWEEDHAYHLHFHGGTGTPQGNQTQRERGPWCHKTAGGCLPHLDVTWYEIEYMLFFSVTDRFWSITLPGKACSVGHSTADHLSCSATCQIVNLRCGLRMGILLFFVAILFSCNLLSSTTLIDNEGV